MKSCCCQTADAPLRVLLVDDEPGDAVVLEAFLEMQEGFQCVGCAANGEDALKFLSRQETPVDAVLLDVYMPGMDGIDFLREWQKMPYPKPKVFVLSAYGSFGEDQIRHQVLRLGVAAYFEKGYPLDLICKRIRDLCAVKNIESIMTPKRECVLEELSEELIDDLLPATKSVGRHYLMDALNYLTSSAQRTWRICEVYDWIAEKNGVSCKSVDRALRQMGKEIAHHGAQRWQRMTAGMELKDTSPSNKILLEMLKREVLYRERYLVGSHGEAGHGYEL